MRKFDELVQKCDNDKEKAYKYLIDNNLILEYKKELTEQEKIRLGNLWEQNQIELAGGVENFKRNIKMRIKLNTLNLTEEEVRNAETNIYKAKILKKGLLFGILFGTVLVSKLISNVIEPKLLMTLISGLGTVLSLATAEDIVAYFKFKKLKKWITEKDERETNSAQTVEKR